MRSTLWLMVLAGLLAFAPPAAAQITPIGPFTGDYFDNFNNLSSGGGGGNHPSMDVFQGFCTVVAIPPGSVKVEFSSERGGDLVVPRSSPVFFGQICISEWRFDSPISQFGGYFENNSRFSDAQVKFLDVNNNLIGEVTANIPQFAQSWTWNGWESTVPVSKIQVAGNDVLFFNGFIWFEDFNVTVAASVPEPSTYVLLGLTVLIGGAVYYYRRRQFRDQALEVA